MKKFFILTGDWFCEKSAAKWTEILLLNSHVCHKVSQQHCLCERCPRRASAPSWPRQHFSNSGLKNAFIPTPSNLRSNTGSSESSTIIHVVKNASSIEYPGPGLREYHTILNRVISLPLELPHEIFRQLSAQSPKACSPQHFLDVFSIVLSVPVKRDTSLSRLCDTKLAKSNV
jgi:hypothetical protein